MRKEQLLKELIQAETLGFSHILAKLKEGKTEGAKYLMELFHANKILFANRADRFVEKIAQQGWEDMKNGYFIIILFQDYDRNEFAKKMARFLEYAYDYRSE